MEELRDPITGRWTLMVANVNKLWGTTEVEFHLQRTIPFWHEINCEILLMQHKNLGGLKNRGVAHLELSSSAEAVRLHRYMVDTDYAIGDAPLRIDWRRPERYDDTIRAVYAANAPVTITKSDVSALFGRFGQIESIFLSAELPKKAPHPTGRRFGRDDVLTWHALQQRRDWLVVTYAQRESAVEAIRSMHGHLLNGYKMALTFYVQGEKKAKEQLPPPPPQVGAGPAETRASKKARYDFYCEKCDVVCFTAEKLHEHLAGRKHQTFVRPPEANAPHNSNGSNNAANHTQQRHGNSDGHSHNRRHLSSSDRDRDRDRSNHRFNHHHDHHNHHTGRGPYGGGGNRDERDNRGARKRGRNDDDSGGYYGGGGQSWASHHNQHYQPAAPLLPPAPAHFRCQLCEGFGHTAKECPSLARAAQPPAYVHHQAPVPPPYAAVAAPPSPYAPAYGASPTASLASTASSPYANSAPYVTSPPFTAPYGGYAPSAPLYAAPPLPYVAPVAQPVPHQGYGAAAPVYGGSGGHVPYTAQPPYVGRPTAPAGFGTTAPAPFGPPPRPTPPSSSARTFRPRNG